MIDALHAGTDSSQSPSIEPAPKDSRAPVTERVESSLEIPETPEITLEMMQRAEDSPSEDGEEHHSGSTQTVVGASMVAGDAVLESNVASSSLRDRSYNEHDTDSVKADDLQAAGRTASVINTSVFDEAPLSSAESSGQTLTSATVSASSLPNIGKNDLVVIDISCFTTAKILDKRSSPFGVEYRCELGPVWLSSVLVKEIPMGGVRIRSYEMDLYEQIVWGH